MITSFAIIYQMMSYVGNSMRVFGVYWVLNILVLALRDYLKTGMRAASPGEQEVQDGEAEAGPEAAATDLARA